MSKFKQSLEQVEELYHSGLSDAEIARRLDLPVAIVEDAVAMIAELDYHQDMLESTFETGEFA